METKTLPTYILTKHRSKWSHLSSTHSQHNEHTTFIYISGVFTNHFIAGTPCAPLTFTSRIESHDLQQVAVVAWVCLWPRVACEKGTCFSKISVTSSTLHSCGMDVICYRCDMDVICWSKKKRFPLTLSDNTSICPLTKSGQLVDIFEFIICIPSISKAKFHEPTVLHNSHTSPWLRVGLVRPHHHICMHHTDQMASVPWFENPSGCPIAPPSYPLDFPIPISYWSLHAMRNKGAAVCHTWNT